MAVQCDYSKRSLFHSIDQGRQLFSTLAVDYHTGQTNGAPLRWPTISTPDGRRALHLCWSVCPSLALLLIVAAASSTDASYLRKLGGTTIATNVKTYAAYDDYAPAMLAAVNKQRATKGLSPVPQQQAAHRCSASLG
ncbi:hypothetical protein GN244_ATG14198 [Phytophthora infestans]|uniref:Uncharacterized protein n=1 Tax=Phytophthora infestans TaxID=4787 RepID=A0A833SNE8_PHYIN|nr:hypothetical protein GN244_ATG14198 [Phytophthora infestans]